MIPSGDPWVAVVLPSREGAVMEISETGKNTTTAKPGGAWSPLRNRVFRALWFATLVSNIGTWMHDVGAGWLMTSLSPSPVMVALIQTATTLPIFLLAFPAGSLADIVDRRRYLIVVQVWMAIVAALLAGFVLFGTMTTWGLVLLTFAMGIGSAMMMPAWAAVTPEVVPRANLQSAIALNSMGVNVARAIGPAVGGVIIAYAGPGAVFAMNALTYLFVIVVLMQWKREVSPSDLPAERLWGAIRSGVRFARNVPALQAAVIRGVGFFLFASASWALLPLVAKDMVDGGPQAFGSLVASVGVGAVVGALVLPRIRGALSQDALVAIATFLYAATMWAMAELDQLFSLCVAMAISGIAWITVLSSLQVAAQTALPSWVRSRGIAVFMTAFMGAMALGSLFWGKIAALSSTGQSLMIASAGAVVAVFVTWRWKLGTDESVDLSPSMHWPTPSVHDATTGDRGPVLVTIDYHVQPGLVEPFLRKIRELGARRKRDGAFAWSIFEHLEQPNSFIETFTVESWLEHLRQHERVTKADHILQDDIRSYLVLHTEPNVSHYVGPDKSLMVTAS